MSRISIIILSSLGLMVIGVIFLFINAGKKKTSDAEIEVMTQAPDKYTYQQLMASAGEHGLSIDDQKDRDATNSQPAANKQLLTDDSAVVEEEEQVQQTSPAIPDPEITKALKEIRQTRQQLSEETARSKPDIRHKDQEEDEQIRRIIAAHSPAPTAYQDPGQVPVSTTTANAGGYNSMQFSQHKTPDMTGSGPASYKAVILNEVEVVNGAAVPIMLIDNHKIVNGTVNIGPDRVQIQVPGAAIGDRFAETVFAVYAPDGVEGLRIEGAEDPARQVATNEVENGVNQVVGSGVLGSVVNVARVLATPNKGKQVVRIQSGLKISLKTRSH